ncbi:DUF58 domain-containing protein [Bowmanella dokdonensis]|uniref:DUF58 domain-containing protein n=1 Tax=Bowmanella dokdonensis TaxID=751969 RepID=A0A939DLL6_9ALTE|nr:DUF58 domain-containing protein [Bowmanella dokdonensis]MBN7825004.1 DUF58 domain-containing protein [Bowmanella dokdonensis]
MAKANLLQRKMHAWLERRIPGSREFTLNRNNIFIFPSRFGLLYLILCLALFILGTNYQNNLILILGYFLLSLFLVSLLASYLNFAGIRLQLGKVSHSFAGDVANLPIWILGPDNDRNRFGRLHFSWYGQQVRQSVELSNMTNPVGLELDSPERGILRPPRVTLCSYYPLGLFRCWTHLSFDCEVIVYPAPLPCNLPLISETAKGETEGPLSVEDGHDNFDSLTEYRPGQPLYHVAWKQVAKGQGMISKKFSSQARQSAWLKLLPQGSDRLEHQLSELCFMILELDSAGMTYGLELGGMRHQPDKGNEHLHRCLTALALYRMGS